MTPFEKHCTLGKPVSLFNTEVHNLFGITACRMLSSYSADTHEEKVVYEKGIVD